jgi:hypothetical protein
MIRALAIAATLLACLGVARAANRAQDPAATSSETQSSVPSPPATQVAKTPKPKPKKVWTNEELGEVGGTISVVGDPRGSATNHAAQSRQAKPVPAKSPNGAVDPKTLAAVRQQLQKLQSDLAVVEKQLAQLQGFSKGDSKDAGGLQSNTWQYNSSSVEEQLRHLQEKKANFQTAIDNLLDAARASGIEPGQLR